MRLWSIHALRGLCVAAGAAAAAVLVAAQIADPILTHSSANWVWSSAALAALAALALSLAPLRHYRGARIAELLHSDDPALAYRMRSALELRGREQAAGTSLELLAAHLHQVQAELARVPRRRVLPWSRVLHVSLFLGAFGLLLFSSLFARQPALRSFVHALVAPAHERSDGTRIARVVERWRVQLTFPSYLGREPITLDNPERIEAPAGTRLELQISASIPADRGHLRMGAQSAPLTAAEDNLLHGQWNAQHGSNMRIELESRGVRYEDPRAIALHVVADQAPQISIDEPRNGSLAPPSEAVGVIFSASDDVGIASIDLFVRLADGAEKQRQVFSALDDGGPRPQLQSILQLVPAELGAREGDTLVLWLEARDADLVSGPHTGKSREITLEVAQPGRGLSDMIPNLQQIADMAVDLLGKRLEQPPPKDLPAAKQRFMELERAGHAWLGLLDAVTKKRADRDANVAGTDIDQLRGMRRRTDHLQSTEQSLHMPVVQGINERTQSDARHIDELERDVLLLADMLARAHVDEAKAIADELRQLKSHIESLLTQLGKTHSPEAERELMREIAKAQRRLAELAQSLSRMATRVPGEFVNRDAMQEEAAESSLSNLERAVQDHDLQAAAQHLDALAKQIDELAAQLGQGGLRLQEQRFGPRDQALAEARQKLGMLSSEQNRLAERSEQVMRNAQARAQPTQGRGPSGDLAEQAAALEQSAAELARKPGNGWQSAAAGRALERLRDARDALRSGDLAGARGMANHAQRSLEETAAELAGEAGMFPGHHGETAQRAELARRAAADAQRLSESIERAMPDPSQHINEQDRERLRGDADSQRKTGEATDQLKQAFNRGPDGLPLSPEAVDELESARESMRRAERALQRGRPDDASREQHDARERLQKLAQSLADKQNGMGGRSRGNSEGANGSATRNAPVHIPGTEEFHGPAELRRKLLDAMQEGSPAGYEAATQRYYRELMR